MVYNACRGANFAHNGTIHMKNSFKNHLRELAISLASFRGNASLLSLYTYIDHVQPKAWSIKHETKLEWLHN